MKDFYIQKGAGQGSYTSKKWIGCGKVIFLQETAGPVRQLTSLVLTREFQVGQFKIPFLGEAKTGIKVGINSQVGDMGLCTIDSTLGLSSFFPDNVKSPEA